MAAHHLTTKYVPRSAGLERKERRILPSAEVDRRKGWREGGFQCGLNGPNVKIGLSRVTF